MLDPIDFKGSASDIQTKACGSGWYVKLGILENYGKIKLTEACKRHDYRYEFGINDKDKLLADLYFFVDLLELLIPNLNVLDLHLAITKLMIKLDSVYTQYSTDLAWKEFYKVVNQKIKIVKLNWFRKYFRLNIAMKYFMAVIKFGDKYY